MKSFILSLGLWLGSMSLLLGQAPQSFFYQAVARDASGILLDNQAVSFRLSVRQGSLGGAIAYQEIHPASTNDYGLVNLEVGTGLVSQGVFSAIDWSAGPYFLEVEFDPNGGFSFLAMGGSQLISVPYALHAGSVDSVDDADADPSNEIQSLSLSGSELSISGANSVTLPAGGGSSTLDEAYDGGGAGLGRTITADAGAVAINNTNANGVGLDITTAVNGSVGLRVNNQFAGNAFSAIQSETNSNSAAASAVIGSTTGLAWGVSGQVASTATSQAGVYGSNLRTNGGHGVLGIGFNGVVGESNYSTGYGIFAENYDAIAPLGNGVGVAGTGYYGVLGEDRYLGSVVGAFGVFSNGNLGASGVKAFYIDHPAAPEDKYLRHFSIESNEVLNVYRGVVVCDEQGEAVIHMPEYFDLINTEPSYQLTPIGGYAPVFIAEELEGGQFTIGGASPGMKVSWELTALRNDPYLQQNPEVREVVVEKDQRSKGKLLIPQLYGKGDESRMFPKPAGSKQELIPLK